MDTGVCPLGVGMASLRTVSVPSVETTATFSFSPSLFATIMREKSGE